MNFDITKIHVLLQSFYLSYDAWVKRGAPDSDIFSRDCGLCANLYDWCNVNHLSGYMDDLLDMLHDDFEKAGLDKRLPFNQTSPYSREMFKKACHENKERLQWVQDNIDFFKKEQGALRNKYETLSDAAKMVVYTWASANSKQFKASMDKSVPVLRDILFNEGES